MFRQSVLAAGMALAPLAAAACPDWSEAPFYGDVSLAAGFQPDPHVINVVAGGTNDLRNCGFGGTGFVATKPDYDLYWSGNSRALTIRVQSGVDTVLLINGPDGSWHFDDDTHGTNPSITLTKPAAGLYDIWVGSYNPNGYADAQLIMTER